MQLITHLSYGRKASNFGNGLSVNTFVVTTNRYAVTVAAMNALLKYNGNFYN